MKLIILSLLSTLLLSSCNLDTVTVRTVTPTPRYYRVMPTNHLYQFPYRYNVRPDYIRYRYGSPRRGIAIRALR